MTDSGVRTTNISNRTAVIDEIIANRSGSTAVIAFEDLAIQLGATGFLADEIAALVAQLVNLQALAAISTQWKDPVRLAASGNVNVATGLVNGATIDSTTLATGDRVLLMGQTAPAENGVYVVVASGAASRAADADQAIELLGLAVFVTAGTANAGKQFICVATGTIVVGTTALPFKKISDQAAINAAIASLATQLNTLSTRIDNLTGADAVSDIYDESTTVGTTSVVVVSDNQPVVNGSIYNTHDTAEVWIGPGNRVAVAGGVGMTRLPPKTAVDQKGWPPGAISAISTVADTPLQIMIGNNSKISPNAERRASALLRAMDTARGTITAASWEAAIRTLYCELDRLGILKSAAAFGMLAADTAAAALIDWGSGAANADGTAAFTTYVPVNAPTFTAKLGYTFDGATNYIRTFRRMSMGKNVTAHRGAVALGAKYGGAVQLSKWALSDGAWGIDPYRSGTTWGALVSTTQADVASGFTTADAEMLAQREDDFSLFVTGADNIAQRFNRDGRETLLNSDLLIGANNSSGDTVVASSYCAVTAKWIYAGPPLGRYQWLAMRAAINTYLTAISGL